MLELTISATEEEWKVLEMIAAKNHNGRSITNLLVMEMSKKIGDVQESEICEVAAVSPLIQKKIDISGRLGKIITCNAGKRGLRPSTYVTRMVVDVLLAAEAKVSD